MYLCNVEIEMEKMHWNFDPKIGLTLTGFNVFLT